MRSAVDVEGIATFDADELPPGKQGPKRYRKNMEAHDLGIRARVGGVRSVRDDFPPEERANLLHIAGVDAGPVRSEASRRDALAPALAEQASEIAGAVPQRVHPRDRLLSARGHGALRISARADHRGRRGGAGRQMGISGSADAGVPAPAALSGPRRVHDGRRREVGVAGAGRSVIPGAGIQPDLKFDGDPALAADAKRTAAPGRRARRVRQLAGANAPIFHLVAPGAPLPKGIQYASPPRVESIRCARRVSPDGARRVRSSRRSAADRHRRTEGHAVRLHRRLHHRDRSRPARCAT